jgi:hypothetical protein
VHQNEGGADDFVRVEADGFTDGLQQASLAGAERANQRHDSSGRQRASQQCAKSVGVGFGGGFENECGAHREAG